MNAILLLLTMTGCDLDSNTDTGEEKEALSDWTDGFEVDDEETETGTTTDPEIEPSDSTLFSVFPRSDLPYEVRLNDATNADNPCGVTIPDDNTGYQRMECIYEIPELDLYGNNFTFDLYVPASACEYLRYSFYMYQNFEIGAGPATASYSLDEDGNILNRVNVDAQGDPVCEFNHGARNPDFPNCCTGQYVLTVTDADGVSESDPPRGWGGDESECYDGAAFYDTQATFDQAGFPTAKIVYLDGGAFSRRFEWNLLSEFYGTNVPLSNYYDPADHNNNKPAGLLGTRSREFYTFECYDNAEELLAKIDLVVREWNEYEEFLNSGDPNTEGSEPVSGTEINDRADWADATPGDDSYIELRH